MQTKDGGKQKKKRENTQKTKKDKYIDICGCEYVYVCMGVRVHTHSDTQAHILLLATGPSSLHLSIPLTRLRFLRGVWSRGDASSVPCPLPTPMDPST